VSIRVLLRLVTPPIKVPKAVLKAKKMPTVRVTGASGLAFCMTCMANQNNITDVNV
jgi:hypothetical protein